MGSCRVCVICWRPSSVHGSPWTGDGRVLGGHTLIGEFGVEVWSERRDVGSCRVRCTSCKPISAFWAPRTCWPAPKHPRGTQAHAMGVGLCGGGHRFIGGLLPAGVRSRTDTDKARAPTRHPRGIQESGAWENGHRIGPTTSTVHTSTSRPGSSLTPFTA